MFVSSLSHVLTLLEPVCVFAKDSGSSNLGICSHTVQSAVQATKTQFTTCVSYADVPTPYFTGDLELGNIVVGAPDAGQTGSVGAAPEVFDNVGFTIMSNSSMEAFHMCGNKANFYDGVLPVLFFSHER